LPFLVRHKIPCTYFVTLDAIQNGTPFPHDVKAGVPLAPNTVEQICKLADAGIDIGAHTRTHPDIGSIADPDQLHDEIVSVKTELELLTQKAVSYFAFPFGLEPNMTADSIRIARGAGYLGVCSAYGAYNFPTENNEYFHLQRIHADPEMSRLKNWLTLDRRKLAIAEPEYFSHATATEADSKTYTALQS
jgi:peptidoglycan/xylan/chitin deacetylase (PgdA/CDA1 family)